MAKYHFNVGDKVVPKDPERWEQGNNIGTVVVAPRPLIIAEWERNGTKKKSYFVQPDIKHASQTPQKGKQLLLDFMIDCCYIL